MSSYDFIFSGRSSVRISRHVLFWLVCWVFFEFTYFLPYYWYPGWNTQNAPATLKELGSLKFYFIVLANTSFGIIIQMFFTYILVYLLLPRYLLKEKYLAFIVSLLLLLIVSVVLFLFEFKYGNPLVRRMVGRPSKKWSTKEQIGCSVDLVFFNCPAIGGMALAIKLLKRWWLKQRESQQLVIAKTGAELQLLKAQVHPHFLFNTLNNIYSFTLCASPKAPAMVKKLSGLLYYIIYECQQPLVPLEKEIRMVQDYMALERIRYGDELDMTIEITGNYFNKMIAPLLLIPFVENSFKHGTSKMLSRPWIALNIIVEKNSFYFMLNNSKPEEYNNPYQTGGLGLTNVTKRLNLLYPGNHKLNMTEEQQHFTVLLEINLQEVMVDNQQKPLNKKLPNNEMV